MKYPLISIACASLACAIWTGLAADTKELWAKNCASCHGEDGRAQTKAGKKAGAADLTDTKIQDKFSDDAMFQAVKEGVKKDNLVKMKPAERLSDAEIRKLIKYVRGFRK